jgi:flagellar protein FliO/FliZ
MDTGIYLRFVLALVFVLALIGLLAWLARRFGIGVRMPAKRGQAKRLSVIEVTSLDPKRRLVLIRRDDTEHLLLLGATGDRVIEGGIAAPAEPPAGPETRR